MCSTRSVHAIVTSVAWVLGVERCRWCSPLLARGSSRPFLSSTYSGEPRFSASTTPSRPCPVPDGFCTFLDSGRSSVWLGASQGRLKANSGSVEGGVHRGRVLHAGGAGRRGLGSAEYPHRVAAVLIGTIPMWILVLEWVRPGGSRPGLASRWFQPRPLATSPRRPRRSRRRAVSTRLIPRNSG